MSETKTLLLGLLAGSTILLGLPVGRLRSLRPGLRQFLNAIAIGILVFLVWDVLAGAFEPIDGALGNLHEHQAGFAPVVGYSVLFFVGLTVGLMSLVYYERWLSATARGVPKGPGAMAVGELSAGRTGLASWSPARRLSLLIAIGIGLHNFAEGLAIGQSAAQGAIGLATVLVIGFALHNATEGFGIVAPLTGERDRPSWGFLLTLGLIAGGPTFFGTVIGSQFTSTAASVLFLSLAAGSILYVVVQLLGVAQKVGMKEILYWGLLVGLAAGFLTDMIVTAGGI